MRVAATRGMLGLRRQEGVTNRSELATSYDWVPRVGVFQGDRGMVQRTVIGWFVVGSLSFLSTATLRAADEKPNELLQMVVDLIGDKDKDFRAAGLDQVRSEAKGPAATKLFAAQLPKLDASAQVGLLSALADRGDRCRPPGRARTVGVQPGRNRSCRRHRCARQAGRTGRFAAAHQFAVCQIQRRTSRGPAESYADTRRDGFLYAGGRIKSRVAGRESRTDRGARHAARNGRVARFRGGYRRRQRPSPRRSHGGARTNRQSRANCRHVAGRAQGRERSRTGRRRKERGARLLPD